MDASTGRADRILWRKIRLDAARWLVFAEVLYPIEVPAAPCVCGDFAPPAAK